jgi:hypothetical protein
MAKDPYLYPGTDVLKNKFGKKTRKNSTRSGLHAAVVDNTQYERLIWLALGTGP